MIITVPAKIDFSEALIFSSKLASDPIDDDRITFDFSNIQFIEPATMLLLMSSIKVFNSKHDSNRVVDYIGHDVLTGPQSYMRHMNFFYYIDADDTKSTAPENGKSSYIPINWMDVDEFMSKTLDHQASYIDEKCITLAQMLIRDEGQHRDLIQFSLREIIRNVIEHSKSEYIAFCGQYWRNNNTVEISVIDAGCGILQSLKENPQAKCTTDAEALDMALLPGVSSKMYRGVEVTEDPWQNSG